MDTNYTEKEPVRSDSYLECFLAILMQMNHSVVQSNEDICMFDVP